MATAIVIRADVQVLSRGTYPRDGHGTLARRITEQPTNSMHVSDFEEYGRESGDRSSFIAHKVRVAGANSAVFICKVVRGNVVAFKYFTAKLGWYYVKKHVSFFIYRISRIRKISLSQAAIGYNHVLY